MSNILAAIKKKVFTDAIIAGLAKLPKKHSILFEMYFGDIKLIPLGELESALEFVHQGVMSKEKIDK